MTNRRAFLGGLIAAAGAPRLGWSAVGSPSYIAAAREPDGTYAIHGIDADGRETFAAMRPAGPRRGQKRSGSRAAPDVSRL